MGKAAKAKRPTKEKPAAKSRPEWFEQWCDDLEFERSDWPGKEKLPPELQRDPRQRIWEKLGLSGSAGPPDYRRFWEAAKSVWPFPTTPSPPRPPRELVYFDSLDELRADATLALGEEPPYDPSERAYTWRRSMGNLFTRGISSESPPGWPEWACGDEKKISAARVARWNGETHPLNPTDGEFFGFAEAVVDWCDRVKVVQRHKEKTAEKSPPRKKKAKRHKTPPCRECGGKAETTSSLPAVRKYKCTDSDCGHTWQVKRVSEN